MTFQTCEGQIISRLELVLPKNVLQTCVSLQSGFGAEFLSTNFQKCTASRIQVSKQIDDSVRIILTVSRLKQENKERPEHILIHSLKSKNPTEGVSADHYRDVTKTNTADPVDAAAIKPSNPSSSQSCTKKEANHLTEYNLASKDFTEVQPESNSASNAASEKTLDLDSPREADAETQDLQDRDIFTEDLPLRCSSSVDDSSALGGATDAKTASGVECASPLSSCNNIDSIDALEGPETAVRTRRTEDPVDDVFHVHGNSGHELITSDTPRDNNYENDTSESITPAPEETDNSPPADASTDNNKSGGEVETRSSQTKSDKPAGARRSHRTRRAKLNAKGKTPVDRSHMKRPHYKREQNVPCQFCSAKLKDYDSLYDHAKLKHAGAQDYKQFVAELRETMKVKCQVCDRIYSRRDQLNVHMKVVHGPMAAVTCPDCGICVKSERHLKDHVRRIHSQSDRVFLCHLCPAAFKAPAYLSAHLKYVHTSNKEDAFPCDQCEKTYSTEKYLRNHQMRVHGSRRYTCAACGKAFSTHANLRRHVVLLHEKKGDKPFQCEVCGRKFTLKANLKDHVNTIHLNTYALRCSVCGLGFRRRKDLQSHEAHTHGTTRRSHTPGMKRLAPAGDGPITVMPLLPAAEPSDSGPPATSRAGVQYIIATPEILEAFGIPATADTSSQENMAVEASTSEGAFKSCKDAKDGKSSMTDSIIVQTLSDSGITPLGSGSSVTVSIPAIIE